MFATTKSRRNLQAGAGCGQQLGVICERDKPDGRRVDDLGAAALEQGDQLFGAARRGHPYGESGQRQDRRAPAIIVASHSLTLPQPRNGSVTQAQHPSLRLY